MRCLAAISPDLENTLDPQKSFRINVDGADALLGQLNIKDVQFDAAAQEYQDAVLVRVTAFSLNYREKHRVLSTLDAQTSQFRVLGSEFVAIVEEVGEKVSHLTPGDRVIGNGCVDLGLSRPGLSSTRASAEYQVFASHKVLKVPDAMPDDVAAAFSVGAQTAYSMVNRLPVIAGEHVVVTGATSNTSLFALKKLLNKQVHVHAITTNPETQKQLQAKGIKQVCTIDRKRDFSQQFAAYLQENNIPFIDHVVDPFMDVYLPKLLPFLRRFGFYVSCGVARQSDAAQLDDYSTSGLSVPEVFSLILRKSITLIGNNLGVAEDLQEALRDYETGLLTVDIDNVFDSHQQLQHFVAQSFNQSSRFGKVIYRYPQLEQANDSCI